MRKGEKIDKRPRILCIGPLPPPIHGSSMMTMYIKDSEYINERVHLDWVNLSTSRSMEEIGQRSIKKILRFALSYLKTFGFLLRNKYDRCYLAITCHGSGFLKDAPFVLACKMFGRKVILHQHNKGMSSDVNRPLYRWLLKLVYRGSKVVLLSQHLYPDIKKIVSKDQVMVCPNGIPCDIQHTEAKKKKKQRPVLLFLSNLLKSKGVITVLDACSILKDRGYKFECRFVGGETAEIDKNRFINETTSRGIEDMVVYVGKKYGDEKIKEFSSADIFVFPTYYDNECFPLVILEAMQHSLPIISTNEGGIPDIIDNEETGIIVPPKDPETLANAISQLLDSPQRREDLGRKANEKFTSKFTLRKFEENMLACLTSPI